MKNLCFVLLAFLFTACLRAPHRTTLPNHLAVPRAVEPTEQPHAAEAYASFDEVAAAAGSASAQTGAPSGSAVSTPYPATVGSAKGTGQGTPTRREIRKAVQKVLLSGRLPAKAQDDPVVPKQNGLARASLIAGVGGIVLFVLAVGATAAAMQISGVLFLLSLIAGILAVVFGAVAKGQIRDGKGSPSDRGMATTGLIMGLVTLGIFVLLLLLAILFILAWSGSI
jgi:hypothetical protein